MKTGRDPSLSGRALATLFGQVVHGVVLERTGTSPNIVRLTENAAMDTQDPADDYSKRDTKKRQLRHKSALIVWDH